MYAKTFKLAAAQKKYVHYVYILSQQRQFDFATHSDYNRKEGDYASECDLFLFNSSSYHHHNYPQTLTAVVQSSNNSAGQKSKC